MLKFMIIADDLSGACDTAVQFRTLGYPTLVLNRIDRAAPLLDRFQAMAVTTNSRDAGPDAARKAVLHLCPFLKGLKNVSFYKKIDSTWRGNIGAELTVLMAELGLGFSLICSAFPENRRLGVGGYLLVDGRLLHRTALAKDPASPITEGYLPGLLARQTDLPVRHLPLGCVERGADAVRREIEKQLDNGPCLFVADAVETGHLDSLAAIRTEGLPPFIFAGSAGLSAALLRTRWRASGRGVLPVLTVAGSVQPRTIAQVDHFIQNCGIEQIYLPWDKLVKSAREDLNAFASDAAGRLQRGADLVIRTCRSEQDAQAAVSDGKRAGLSGARIADAVSEGLRRVLVDALARTPVRGLMVTGGSTALKLLEGVSGEGIEVFKEIEPGVPLGRIVGGKMDGTRVITKAGGFGSLDVFCIGIQAMKREE